MRYPKAFRWWILGAVLGGTISCGKQADLSPPTEVRVAFTREVPDDPFDPAWQKVPEYPATLITQDLVEPRQLSATTTAVRLRALGNGTETSFRLEWEDPSRDDLPGAARFCDACAIQIPQLAGVNVPAPQMGEAGHRVEITYWNASQQALVDGRGQTIQTLYPNAAVDHYPFEAKPLEQDPAGRQAMATRYAPARAVGNPVSRPPATPVQDLVAAGPGTLTSASSSTSRGQGRRTAHGWAVVIVRRAPPASEASGGTNIALAVWDGARQEAGARKMRTGWIPLVPPVKP